MFPLRFQDFRPVKNICAHLNAFHVYANDTSRFVETNHYCSHLNEGKYWLQPSFATQQPRLRLYIFRGLVWYLADV